MKLYKLLMPASMPELIAFAPQAPRSTIDTPTHPM